ncbi:MAG: deoxyribose-phosphate aldolase [Anaerolineae bacterium]|jgi:deoxyribose-phosphate aldolase|nr:deoxyribose-phosphate aldolase [Anaerolineae bacterium]MBT4310810.1 deoxyribose-phosphate aldolase [Anaerolineae bacterium]MBT4456842.1 deoxyribose-phosphate aldolase [Anaerolineae bacterium]MBT6323378.1 deoxyribose-phosphate aldolase [Anaerolineae bacterium]MBT6814663.1 deoxyribose-phosphate aldolase [Anaerolineae bacterium]
MAIDPKNVEKIVEVITREVLRALTEQEAQDTPDGAYCAVEEGDGILVKTCFDDVGHVISAGAERISSTLGRIPEDLDFGAMIDHTLLKPDATPDQIAQLCYEARKYEFASVCINPAHVRLCADLLRGADAKVCTVIGFPLGASAPDVKVFETETALRDGATEIDMVINIGALKGEDHTLVARDIQGVVEAGHKAGALVKVIIETALLTEEEKVTSCLLAKEAGADYVKTSTGFSGGGATVEDIALMRRVVGPTMGVKASGGVRSREDAENLVKAGATRLGASAGVKIVQGEVSTDAY